MAVPYDPTKPPMALQDRLRALDSETQLAIIPPSILAARGMRVFIDGTMTAEGVYDAATLVLIAEKQAEGWPEDSIVVQVDNTSSIASRAAAGEVVQVLGYTTAGGGYDTATQAAIAAKQALGWPDYAIWVRVMGESGTSAVSATASIPSFTSLATLTAPSVTAQLAAVASVPQFAASATLTAPTVSAQRAANVSVPSFMAVSTLTAPTVTIVPAGAQGATVAVGSFTAQAALTVPTVTAQLAATASVPSFGVTATLTAPSVTAQRAATASVPSFTARGTLTVPTVTAVQNISAPTQPVISATGGDTTVTIALTSGGVGATSYDLKWGTSAGSLPNTISGVTLPYTHTGRSNGTTYYYSLVAVNAGGSRESAEVSATAVAAQSSGPVTLSFETADIVDSSGATWEKVIPTHPSLYSAGVITSGVAGGDTGNALSVKQAYFDDGSDYGCLDTYIRHTMNVGAGTLAFRSKRINNSNTPYIKIGNTYYNDVTATLNTWVTHTYEIAAPLNGVEVQIGARVGLGPVTVLIDSVSIPQ